jgi:hypothetical protein
MPKPDAAHGAGFAGARANAIAKLAAAILRQDRRGIDTACVELDAEKRAGNSPQTASQIRTRLDRLLRGRFEGVTDAQALGAGGPGDLEVRTRTTHHYVEVKAQLEKPSLDDITQADWVRNETDALRYLAAHDREFRARLSHGNASLLSSDPSDFDGWSFASLWLADVALLCDSSARAVVGVATPADLAAFLRRKHILHLSATEERLLPLADLPPVSAALRRATSVSYILKRNSASEVAVPVEVDGGGVVFTYHIYPLSYAEAGAFCGRHKVHGRMFHD